MDFCILPQLAELLSRSCSTLWQSQTCERLQAGGFVMWHSWAVGTPMELWVL